MPLYEYRCPDCNHLFEKLQKFNDSPPTCPVCSCSGTEKQVSTRTGFLLKGHGWHKPGLH